MAVLSHALRQALKARTSPWPGPFARDADVVQLQTRLDRLPGEVQEALLSAFLDPSRGLWARGTLWGLDLAMQGGARVVGMANDDLVELVDPHHERFGLCPVGIDDPRHRPTAYEDLLATLDATFQDRGYVVHVRRVGPEGLDLGPLTRAVRLWLSLLDQGQVTERSTHYDDEDIGIDVAVSDEATTGRLLTIGPVGTLDVLDRVERGITDALVDQEAAVGGLPLVVVLASSRPWALSRGYLQLHLYGTPREASGIRNGSTTSYEALFRPDPPAMFSGAASRSLAALWWLEPGDGAAWSYRSRIHDNPWGTPGPTLDLPGPRFVPAELHPDRSVRMRWRS